MAGLQRVLANMERWQEQKLAGVLALSYLIASKCEAYGKSNKRWINRTSHAVQGLKAGVIRPETVKFIIYFAHSVSYGVFLELAHEGRYSILEETIDKYAKEYFEGVERLAKHA